MAISENTLSHLKNVIASGKATIPALVYAKLKDLGYVTKVEGESAGRGKTVVVATEAGKRAAA